MRINIIIDLANTWWSDCGAGYHIFFNKKALSNLDIQYN